MVAGGIRSVAITAANHGDGVTSVAASVAQRHLLAGRSTLLVDLNLYRPAFAPILALDIPENDGLMGKPQLIGCAGQNITLLGMTAPKQREAIVKLRNPGIMAECLSYWLASFETVIFDTSPINVSASAPFGTDYVPAERVAAACDASVLVVLAGKTKETMVTSALTRLQANNVRLLGCLYNDKENPSLRNELLRVAGGLNRFSKRLASRVAKKIEQSDLLSLDI